MSRKILFMNTTSGGGSPAASAAAQLTTAASGSRPVPRRAKPVVLRCELCAMCGRLHPRKPYLSIVEVAGYLGTAVATIYRKRSARELPPALLLGRSPRYPTCEVAMLLVRETP